MMAGRYPVRLGDGLVLLLALLCVVWLGFLAWQSEAAARVRIYQDGQLFAELDLAASRLMSVPGPLGDTVVEVAAGRARIAKDPSPRQYCVRDGWLTAAGQVAICLPNRTSIELVGHKARRYDSLNY